VTDGASLVVFYTTAPQRKTQVLFDFQYDSNFSKNVRRTFSGINVKTEAPDIILAGPDGQNNAPDITRFIGNSGTGMVKTLEGKNLWNGADPLQYGMFRVGNRLVGNLWDTLRPMRLSRLLLQNMDKQTLAVQLDASPINSGLDCVGISAAVLITPQ
jgi:hypothetical protein